MNQNLTTKFVSFCETSEKFRTFPTLSEKKKKQSQRSSSERKGVQNIHRI